MDTLSTVRLIILHFTNGWDKACHSLLTFTLDLFLSENYCRFINASINLNMSPLYKSETFC